jgi:uncharacterized repeat protein (TIGR01451 family)
MSRNQGQSLVETALVLPIVLLLVFGVFELGRIVFIFSAVNNASREAARYGASTGATGGGVARYLNCDAIRQTARETAFLSGLINTDININYDRPDTGSGTMEIYGYCHGNVARPVGSTSAVLSAGDVQQGDRIVVTVVRQIDPILPFFPSFAPTFVTARTILKDIAIGPPECRDGVDNDGDGAIDWPDDDGCESPDDTIEAKCFRLSVVPLGNPPPQGEENVGTTSQAPGPNCSNLYVEGLIVNLEAYKDIRTDSYFDSHYTFDYWQGDVNTGDGSSNNPTTVTMDADQEIIAHFRLLTSELSVTKSAPSTVLSEQPLTYTISVTNPYTDTARDLVLVDTLPSGVKYEDNWTSSDGSATCEETIDDAEIVCRLASLSSPGTVTFDIEVIAPTVDYTSATITNSVTVSAFEADPNLGNNTATAITTVLPRAELMAHSKDDSADPVYAGDTYDYIIEVGNSGPSIATGVVIRDVLPSAIEFESSVDGCTYNSGTREVRCEVGQLDLVIPATKRFTVRAQGNTRTVTNTAVVSGNEAENNTANNSASENTDILSRVSLGFSKTAPATATRDVPFNYTLTVTNNGPSTAESVVINDPLPAGVQFNSASNPFGTCTQTGITISCTVGAIPKGESRQVTLNVTATTSGTKENTATVTTSTETDDSSVGTASATTMVSSSLDLTIDKRAPDSVTAGDEFTYTIVVGNSGASNAWGVSVVDPLPAGVVFVNATAASNWSCTHSSGLVTCTPNGDIALLPGGSATHTIRVRAPANPGPNPITNTATIDADEHDPRSDSVSTIVNADVDLVLTAYAPTTVDGPFTFTLTVTNNGVSQATAVEVVDYLDLGTTVASVSVGATSGLQCDYFADPARVTCIANTLAAAGSAQVEVIVNPANSGAVSGGVNVTSAEVPTGGNSTTHSTDVLLPEP